MFRDARGTRHTGSRVVRMCSGWKIVKWGYSDYYVVTLGEIYIHVEASWGSWCYAVVWCDVVVWCGTGKGVGIGVSLSSERRVPKRRLDASWRRARALGARRSYGLSHGQV